MFGPTDPEGTPLKKPWRVMTNDGNVYKALSGHLCDGSHVHRKVEGNLTKMTESYTDSMVSAVLGAWQCSCKLHPISCAPVNSKSDVHVDDEFIPKMPVGIDVPPHRDKLLHPATSWA